MTHHCQGLTAYMMLNSSTSRLDEYPSAIIHKVFELIEENHLFSHISGAPSVGIQFNCSADTSQSFKSTFLAFIEQWGLLCVLFRARLGHLAVC